MTTPCAHSFAKVRRWPIVDRFQCTLCGFVTRRYDRLDYAMSRPIHRHMSVAVPGMNTQP